MKQKYYTEEQIREALEEAWIGSGDISEVMGYLNGLPSAESGTCGLPLPDTTECSGDEQEEYMNEHDKSLESYLDRILLKIQISSEERSRIRKELLLWLILYSVLNRKNEGIRCLRSVESYFERSLLWGTYE